MQSNMFFLRFKRETMEGDVLVGVLTQGETFFTFSSRSF